MDREIAIGTNPGRLLSVDSKALVIYAGAEEIVRITADGQIIITEHATPDRVASFYRHFRDYTGYAGHPAGSHPQATSSRRS